MRPVRATLAVALMLWFGAATAADDRAFTILAVNDVYRIDGVAGGRQGGLARLRTLRRDLERTDGDVLVLHGGDVLSPSFVGRLFRGAQMIDVLNHLDGDGDAVDRRLFVTFGNHEFDAARRPDAAHLAARIAESPVHVVIRQCPASTGTLTGSRSSAGRR